LQAIKGHFGNDEYYAVVASIADDLCSVGASPGDLFAAYGEDTFALLLSDCGAEAARLKATQIKQKFAHPHFMAKHEASTRDIYCTVAFTVASPGGGSSTLELIETTEQLMLNSRFIEHDGIVTNAKLLGMEGTSTNPSER
jgi:GGDEF domain-containing protein